MRRIFTGRGLIAAAVMTMAALAGGMTPAGAATAPDGTPILNASSSTNNVAHSCEVLGQSPGFYQAVVCVDINTATDSTGYHASGMIEAFCQDVNPNHIHQTVQCKQIEIDGIFANGTSGSQETYNALCIQFGAGSCPAGRYEWPPGGTTPYHYTGGHDCTSSLGHNVWNVATLNTRIVTPDNVPYSVNDPGNSNDSGNYSSGHYWICP